MKINLLIILILISTTISLSQKDSLVPKVFYYGDGTISSEGFFKNNQPEGYWKTYYPNSQMKSEGNRKNFNLDGTWFFYHDNSDTSEVINYRNGIKNGWHYFYEQNKIVKKQLFLDAKLIGLSYIYKNGFVTEIPHKNGLKHGSAFVYKDSNIVELIEYKNGYKVTTKKINQLKDSLKQGEWNTFYPNRRIKTEINYTNDTLDGFYRTYSINGEVLKNMYYTMGYLDTAQIVNTKSEFSQSFYANGNLKSEGYYLNEVPYGLHKYISQDGKLIEGKLYNDDGSLFGSGLLDKNGRKTGRWLFYDENGNVKSEGFYKKGRRTKTWKFYFADGKIEQEGSYKSGKYHGEWKFYNSKGQLLKKENYIKKKLDGEYYQYDSNGDVLIKGQYNEGIKDGEWIYYYGYVTLHQFFNSGERTGKWYSDYDNGKTAFEGEYEADEPNGKHIYYYYSGEIKEFTYYIFGSKEKIWTTYDKYGMEIKSHHYKNDKLYKINGYKFDLED